MTTCSLSTRTFKVQHCPVFSPVRFSLPYNHSGHYCRNTNKQTRHQVRDRLLLPFFLSSGFPFFTVAKTRSPAPAAGRRFRRPLMPFTAMMYRFLPPVLSAQLMTAPTGKPSEIRNLAPAAPLDPSTQIHHCHTNTTTGLQLLVYTTNGEGFCRQATIGLDHSPRFDILLERVIKKDACASRVEKRVKPQRVKSLFNMADYEKVSFQRSWRVH